MLPVVVSPAEVAAGPVRMSQAIVRGALLVLIADQGGQVERESMLRTSLA